MATLGLCMIVKDEEDWLEGCLSSVREFVDEIVVLDTGSTDATIQIAKKYHAKVHKFKWRDDFAQARNESLRYATADWILILDADEVVAAKDLKKIRTIIGMKKHKDKLLGFTLEQRHYTDDSSVAGWRAADKYKECRDHSGFFVATPVRLFKRNPDIQFEYAVHEDIGKSIIAAGGEVNHLLVPIHHYGYTKGNVVGKQKSDKYLELGLKQIQRTPNIPKPYFEVGKIYRNRREFDKAVEYFNKVIEMNPHFAKVYSTLGETYSAKGDFVNAAKNYRKAIDLNPQEENALNNLGVIFLRAHKFAEGVACFTRALAINQKSAKAYKNLAAAYVKLNHFANALKTLKDAHKNTGVSEFKERHDHLKKSLTSRLKELKKQCEDDPQDVTSHSLYSELLFRMGKIKEARDVLEKAVKQNSDNTSSDVTNLFFNLSNCLVMLKEYPLALRVIDDAIKRDPQSAPFFKKHQEKIRAMM